MIYDGIIDTFAEEERRQASVAGVLERVEIGELRHRARLLYALFDSPLHARLAPFMRVGNEKCVRMHIYIYR